jgi:hypothetical protein
VYRQPCWNKVLHIYQHFKVQRPHQAAQHEDITRPIANDQLTTNNSGFAAAQFCLSGSMMVGSLPHVSCRLSPSLSCMQQQAHCTDAQGLRSCWVQSKSKPRTC